MNNKTANPSNQTNNYIIWFYLHWKWPQNLTLTCVHYYILNSNLNALPTVCIMMFALQWRHVTRIICFRIVVFLFVCTIMNKKKIFAIDNMMFSSLFVRFFWVICKQICWQGCRYYASYGRECVNWRAIWAAHAHTHTHTPLTRD